MAEEHIIVKVEHVSYALNLVLADRYIWHYAYYQGLEPPGTDKNKERERAVTEIGGRAHSFIEDNISRSVALDVRLSDMLFRSFIEEYNLSRWMSTTDRNNPEKLLAMRNLSAAVIKIGLPEILRRMSFDIQAHILGEIEKRRQHDLEKIISLLDKKKEFLLPHLLKARAKGKNKYGDLDDKPILKEISEFSKAYFEPNSLMFFRFGPPLEFMKNIVMEWLEDVPTAQQMPQDGFEFEYWCAQKLEEIGYQCVVSKATGDQGIDVLATMNGQSTAIQCKRYASPIGNKAVQEAYAGMRHCGAQSAAVIGTGGFTKSALELAEATGVRLIDAENISSF